MQPYQLPCCNRTQLSDTLGPPGYFPVAQDCLELSLNVDAVQKGYAVSYAALGVPDADEANLTLLPAAAAWPADKLDHARQVIWGRLRAAQWARGRRRRAGRAYGEPLVGAAVVAQAVGARAMPELRTVGDEAKAAWMQELEGGGSLGLLLEGGWAPHGYFRRTMFETFLALRLPPRRALWFAQCVYFSRSRGDPEARAREWTQHITDFMGGVLADPRGRPQQQQQQAAVLVKDAQHGERPSGTWGCAAPDGTVDAAGWLQIDMAPLIGSKAADKWRYLVRLVGASVQEGLVAISELLKWALPRVADAAADAGDVGAAALLPLLQACIWGVALSTTPVMRVVDAIATRLKALSTRISMPLPARLQQAYTQLLQALIDAAPLAMLSLPNQSLLPGKSTPPLPPVSLTRTPAAGPMAHVAAAVQERVTSLSSAVTARVLSYSEADALAALDAAMPVCCPSAALEALRSAVLRNLPSDQLQGELVRLVCHWGAARALASVAAALDSSPERSAALACAGHLRPVFAVTLLSRMAAQPPKQSDTGGAPVLQRDIVQWLDWEAAASPSNHSSGATITSPRIGELLVRIAEAGLFCPTSYLLLLVARDNLRVAPGGRPSAATATSLHQEMIRHLHAQLQTPWQASDRQPIDTPWSTARRRYAANRAACLGRQSTPRSGQKMDQPLLPLLPVKRKVEDDVPAQPAADQRQEPVAAPSGGAAQPAAGGSATPAPPKQLRWTLRGVLKAASNILGMPTRPPGSNTDGQVDDVAAAPQGLGAVQQLLHAAAGLRPWEQRRLVQQLAAAVPALALSSGIGGLLAALAVLDAAGGAADAAQALLSAVPPLLVAEALSSRTAGSGGNPSAAPPDAAAGTLLAGLRGRRDALAAADLVTKALSAVTEAAWATAQPLQPGSFAAALCAYAIELVGSLRERQDVQAWLGAACQKRPSHWLARRLASASQALPNSAAGAVPLPPQTPADWRRPLSELCGPLHDQSQQLAADTPWQVARGLHTWAQGHGGAVAAAPRGVDACHTAVVETVFQSYVWASRAAFQPAGSQQPGTAAPDTGGNTAQLETAAAAAAALQLHVAVLSHVATLLAAASAGGGSSEASALQNAVIACCRAQFERERFTKRDLRPQAGALLAGCIAGGLVQLEAALAAAGGCAAWVALLLGGPCKHIPAGEAAALMAAQWQASFQAVWTALESIGLGAALCSGGTTAAASAAPTPVPAAAECAPLWGHAPLAAALLQQPQVLYQKLSARGSPWFRPLPASPVTLPARALVAALLSNLPSDSGDQPRQGSACSRTNAQWLLAGLTPASFAVTRLCCRLLLDEQAYADALKRTGRPDSAAAAASAAAADTQKGAAAITDAEKRFVQQVMAELAVRPGVAATAAHLAWGLGRGLGEHLLQLQLWALQPCGWQPLQNSLAQHASKPIGASAASISSPVGAQGSPPDAGVHRASGDTAARQPFAQDAGFVEAALAGLARSIPARQREFVEALVKQLQQLAKATPNTTPGRGSTAIKSAAAGGGSGDGASAAALQAALWLRLALLSPLLPLVYASKEQGVERSLRSALAHALLRLALAPWVSENPAAEGGEAGAATAAAAAAGEPLPQRLAALLSGLLPGTWASWLRGDQIKLREVAQFDGCGRLQQEVAAEEPAARTALRLQTCLPAPPPPGPALPPAAPHGPPNPSTQPAADTRASCAGSPNADAAGPKLAAQEPVGQSPARSPAQLQVHSPQPPSLAAAQRKRRAGSAEAGGSPRGAAKKAKLDPFAWAVVEAVPFDPWLVPEAHASARAATERAASEQRRERLQGSGPADGSCGGVSGGPLVAHWLAGAVRRPRTRLTYAPHQQHDD